MFEKKHKYVRSILCLADTHVGSELAIWPDVPILSDAKTNLTRLNLGQRELLAQWYEMEKVADEFHVDTVIMDGDAVDGSNPKEGSSFLVTPEIDYQVNACAALLETVVKDRKFWSISGTQYHELIEAKIHRRLAEQLRGVASESRFLGVHGNVKLTDTNKRMSVAHEATGAMIYPSSSLDRENVFMKVAESDGALPHFDYVVRAHLHRYFHLDYATEHLIQLPSWKAWFPFKGKARNYGRGQPDTGFVILLIDAADRTTILHWVKKAPHIADFETSG